METRDDAGGSGSLTARIAGGTAWILGARVVMRVVGFVNIIVVARLLAPDDFGVVAVGVTAMQLLQGFSDIGVSQAVVRFRDAGRDDVDTLFTLSSLRGLLLAALLLLIAPVAADLLSDERIFWVFAGVALHPLLIGLVNPRFFEFERDLDFSREFIALVAEKVAAVSVSIAVAAVFRSYHAIILGLIAGATVQLGLSYALKPYRPRFTLASMRKVFGFTGWLTGVGFMAALNNKLDNIILARLLGPGDAGRYYVGAQLSELPTSELAYPIARAIYPGLSALQGSPERLRQAYLRGVEALAAVALPAGLGFAFVAHDLIELLLGGKWREAALVVQHLTPVIAVQTLFLATQFYAMALGMTRLVFVREVAFFLVRTPAFILSTLYFGYLGAVGAAAACGLVHIALNLALYARASADPFWRPLWVARRSLLAAGVMALYFLLLRPHQPLGDISPAGRLLVDIAAGGFAYVGALVALWKAEGEPDGAERAIARLFGGAFGRLAAR